MKWFQKNGKWFSLIIVLAMVAFLFAPIEIVIYHGYEPWEVISREKLSLISYIFTDELPNMPPVAPATYIRRIGAVASIMFVLSVPITGVIPFLKNHKIKAILYIICIILWTYEGTRLYTLGADYYCMYGVWAVIFAICYYVCNLTYVIKVKAPSTQDQKTAEVPPD